MADEEAEKDNGSENVTNKTIWELQKRLQELHEVAVTDDSDSRVHSSSEYCQEFCRTLVDYAGRWKIEDEPLPLVEVYIVALLSYAKAAPYLSRQCENVSVVIDRLSLSFMELLLSLKDIPDDLWGRFKSSLQFVHSTLQENGLNQLSPIATLVQYDGVWNNSILQSLLSNENTQMQLVEEFLEQEGLTLSRMRVKQLMKEKQLEKAALLARACSECAAFEGKGPFKQMYLVCLCTTLSQDKLIEEISKEDCHDALEMICNLDSEGDEMAAFSLCSAFLSRQLLQGDMYCAWELTLIWSKLLKRLEPTEQSFLDRCRQMSLLSKSVYHILFFIKVVQSELDGIGLPACVEMCIRALLMESDDSQTKATMCKTISCLLPSDLEVKRACQLTEFLLEPTVDSYYAVETIYNEPDQKLEEENRPIPNSLRCELLLAFKNLWPFDPEFWDWKTLKRYCLGLMGEEASIVSSIDHLNDNESPEEEEEEEEEEDLFSTEGLNTTEHLTSGTYDLKDVSDKREKNREMKKLREKGFISARFRNWQAYMQYCVLCDKEFLGHRIVRHAQTHVINGVYTCPICALSFTSKDTLLPHVTLHVKQSSKERLSVMKTKKNLANLVNVPDAQSRTENEVRKTNNNLLGSNGGLCREVKVRLERCSTKLIEENICPVGNCRRSFKFFRNLLAHVKTHGDDREAKSFLEMQRKKVVCQYCCRYFLSVNHLNDHLQVHCGARPYICIQLNCNASFLSNTELLAHRKIHSEFKAKCMFPDCGKIFSEAFKLYDHESHHYKTFTCNVADCGQVFNSQQQMDVHQSQHKETAEIQTPEHSSSKVPSESSERVLEQLDGYNEQERGIKVEYASSEVTSQNDASTLVKHAQQQLDVRQDQQNDGKMTEKTPQDCINPTLIEQILLSQMQENYDDNWKTEHFQNPDNETLPNAFESLLKQSQEPVDGKMHYGAGDSNNSTFADRHAQNLSTSVIQEPNSHVYCGESSFVDFSTHQQSHSIAAFEQNVSQGQPQLFQSNASAGLINYCPDSNFLLQGAIGPPCRNNASTASLHQKCLESTMPGPLASTVTPQLHPVSRPETSMTSPTVAVPLSGQRERYHCASPVCTKHYSTYKSVTKHMRTTHPDFYEQWKLNPSKIRISCTSAPCPSDRRLNSATSLQYPQDNSVPLHEAQRQNVIQSPYNNMSKNSNHASGYLQSSSVQNQSTSLLMEDVINPIVLAQLGSGSNISTHSQVPCSRNLHAVHQNKQTDNSGYYQVSSSQQTNDGSVSAVLPVNYSSVMTASLLSRPPESLGPPQMENSLAFPLCVDGEKETSQKLQKTFSTLTSQMESKLVAGSVVPEKSSPHFSDHAGQVINSNRALNGLVVNDAPFGPRPQAKRSSKSKWPAIIKDGKFVCRRCFREFNSSKSLGGHLSKRLTCKPNNEHNFITAQTASGFGPHSKQTILSPGLLGQESLLKTVKTEPSYLQNKSNGTIFKQTASELFLQTPNPRSLFPNTCVPFAANERLPSSSVIQHTESVQLDRNGGVQDNSYNAAHYSESNIDTYTGCDFPEPSLSLIPMEKSSSAVLGNIFTSHFNPGTVHSRGFSAMPTRTPDLNPENQPLLPVGRLSPVSVNEKQAKIQRITSDQDVKKRLREQILSGDFQRRNNSCDQSNADPIINFSEPVSFGQMCTTPVASKYGQMTSDAKKELARHGQDMQGSPNEIQQQNAVSFEGFREPSAPEKDEHGPSTSALIDLDCEPTPLSAIQQLWMAEIQGAFQKLNLLQEISEDVAPKNTTITSQSVLDKVSSPTVMPFRCENVTCPFSSFSSESLWRHLSKSHSYTHEMVNVVKKRYGLYAPYKCQHCVKNFTRNSNLRAHYQSAHKLTSQEIADLDMKRRQTKATPPAHNPKWPINTDQAPVDCNPALAATGLQQDAVLHKGCSQSLLPNANTAATTEANRGDNCCTVSNPLQTSPMNKQHPIMLAQTPTSRQPPGSDDVNAVNVGTSLEAKPSTDAPKKTKERKTNAAPLSPYRPYRCVHQGCVAAFAVQHNLILHYRAVHQAALSSLEVNKEKNQCEELDDATQHEEEPEADTAEMTEFRCQVKDCSGVFQEVQQLLKHYLHLHEFTLDKGGRLLSSTKLGKFTCGHQGCTASFIGSWTYITHIKEQHIDLNLVRSEQLSCLFKCEIEGCDRSYATKSNLLRHAMKIHKELYEPEVKNKQSPKGLHYQITKISNGKENIESNKKILESEKLAKRASHSKRNHWTQYGKPSLKTKGEAIAMCTKTFHLQYPCMIKGCESVMKSERSIMKHYMGHGLSEKYLELQRSHFIFCKKFPRQKAQSIRYEDSKSENASDISNNEESGDSGMEAGEYRRSKTALRKRASRDIPAALFDSKLCVDESSDGSVVIKRKRGRPRKHKKIPHSPKIDLAYNGSDFCHSTLFAEEKAEQSAPMASFKPMGFEMSFLQFLEQSSQSEKASTKKADLSAATSTQSSLKAKDVTVRFRNHQNLKSLSQVKINIDAAFSSVSDLMLKQLQGMHPTVVLGRNSRNPFVLI